MPIPKLVVTIGLMALQAGLAMTKKIEGPRLDELDVTTADYGTPIPRFWGMRRFECPIIWAEKLHEVKKKSKGKSGKYADYRYYGTWAVAIADNEIDTVRRIWLDRHLSYDVSGTGPISIASLFKNNDTVKLTSGRNMRIYLGTETQTPDPRMTEWCEDRYGPDTCPAYRGVSYIVFEEIPLEKFGNRIPQISVEAVHTKTNIYPIDIASPAFPLQRAQFSPDYMRLYITDPDDTIAVWDVPTRTQLLQFASTNQAAPAVSDHVLYGDSSVTGLLEIGLDGGETVLTTNFDVFIENTEVFYVGGFICMKALAGGATLYYSGDATTGMIATLRSFNVNHYFEDLDGNGWAVGEVPGLNKVGFALMPDGPEYLVDTTTTGGAWAMCNEDGKFLTYQNGKLFVVDPDTWTSATPVSASVGVTGAELPFRNIQPATRSIWLHASEYKTSDASLIRTVTPGSWDSSANGSIIYDPVNHALITGVTGGIGWLFLDRVGNAGVSLRTIVDDVSDWCGLSGQDTTALTQTIEGYSVTQGAGKDMIAPLLDIHDVDPRPHDFQVQFVNRGGTPSLTITTSELVREGNDSRYTLPRKLDTDLPRKMTLSFADVGHDQQPNTIIAQRPLDSVDTVREERIDLESYASNPEDAQKFGDRYIRRKWFGRQEYNFALTAQRLALEPADLAILVLDGITTKARLTKITNAANGRLNTEWERDDPAVHVLGPGTGASMDGRDAEVIYIPGPTKGFVKDIPLLSDADNAANPLLYYAAGPYLAAQSWPGAYFMEGVDYDTDWNSVDSASGATWGYSTDALGEADPWLWDRGNTVNVSGYLDLTSCTEADIEADPDLNLALLGDELINFTTATLELDGSYTLSGFKRGRRGTEWATDSHAVNDEFVLASDLIDQEEGLSEVGTMLHFKAQTLAREIDGGAPIDIAYTGATLKPYAPARLDTYYDGTDLQCTIIRRTRVGGAWTGGSTIPLSEASEAYEIDVYNGATLKRTITVSGVNTFTYTSAMATADGITLPTRPTFQVYQMSDAVGRGFALAA